VILGGNRLKAFSTDDFAEKDTVDLNGSIVAARLHEGKIYLTLKASPFRAGMGREKNIYKIMYIL